MPRCQEEELGRTNSEKRRIALARVIRGEKRSIGGGVFGVYLGIKSVGLGCVPILEEETEQ